MGRKTATSENNWKALLEVIIDQRNLECRDDSSRMVVMISN